MSGQTSAGATVVIFGPYTSVQVNVDADGNNIFGDAANEPSMAINPEKPDHIAIGWRQFDSVNSNFRQAGVAYSTNGGQTWTNPGVLDPGRFRSDPVLVADGFGNFYYSSLTLTDLGAYEVNVFKSTDGGVSWPIALYAFGGDKQWMVADERSVGLGAGHIYQSWNVQFTCCGFTDFTRSTNSGVSYENPLELPYPRMKWATLDTDADGVLYMGGTSLDQTGHLFVRSLDARDPAVTPTFEPPVFVNLDGFTGGFGGFDSPNPGGLLGQVWVAAHPFKSGHVYMLGSVIRFGNETDVMFARSTDGGQTWSEPVRVNDDPEFNGAWQWFGTMAVAPNGRIDAIWNDTRHHGVPYLSAVYYSYSMDEGQTWSANVQISVFFNNHAGYPQQEKIGDYYHMISDNGGANLAYAATFTNEQDVYFVRIPQDCNQNRIEDDCDTVCGPNGTRCDVADCGQSRDCNGNHVPDECEPDEDCNTTGGRDLCEIGKDPSLDCNANRTIDKCENSNDCNANEIYDVCDLFAQGDCNHNGVPDDCDAGTTSGDRNRDGMPDECQGACCDCFGCGDISKAECRFHNGIFGGASVLCMDPQSCESPVFDHDLCEFALELPSAPQSTTAFDNRCAYWDLPYEVPCPSNQYFGTDLWFNYVAPSDGVLEVNTCEVTEFDAILAVYQGDSAACFCPTTNDGLLDCGDDTCGFGGGPAFVVLQVAAGHCYTIRVGGWDGSTGTGELSIAYLTVLRDFAIFENCFGPVGQGCEPSDFNHDGVVDVNDYLAFLAMFGS